MAVRSFTAVVAHVVFRNWYHGVGTSCSVLCQGKVVQDGAAALVEVVAAMVKGRKKLARQTNATQAAGKLKPNAGSAEYQNFDLVWHMLLMSDYAHAP